MKTKRGSKLFKKYMLNMFALIIVALIIMSTMFLTLETKRWNDEQTKTLLTSTSAVADNIENLMKNLRTQEFDASTPIYMVSNALDAICSTNGCDVFICDIKGEALFCRDMLPPNENTTCPKHSAYKIPESIINKATKGNYSELTTLGNTFNINQLVVASPITSKGSVVGIVFAVKPVAQTLYIYFSQIAKIMLLSAAISLCVSAVIIYGMVYKTTKPLRQMSYATKLYSNGDFSYKVEVKGNDEMAELASAFNKMASSLAALESSRRSFVANVSHELKTPMTTIGGFIDGILDGTIGPEQEKRYLTIVSEEVKRLSRLVIGMLNMSKLEAGEMKINATQFDLSQAIFKTLLNFEKEISAKSIEILGLETMQRLKVNADEDMLLQVVYNLIDNAVKFTPKNGYISIKTFTDGDKAFVSIRNSGNGLSQEEQNKIFERFYKSDRSRSYDVKGAGLGLYIVKSIISLHSGEIKVSSKLGEYTEFTFFIPIG